jgi:phosphomannomutase
MPNNTSFKESHIYRCDHILGLVDGMLSAELYRNWGYGLGRMLESGSLVVVSADIRVSSVPFKSALVEGLLASGIHVVDVGLVPTDLAAYAKDVLSAVGFVCVSGDWYPSSWNGLRWRLDATDLSVAEQVMQLREITSNSPVIDMAAVQRSMPNRFRKRDITFHWIAWAQDVWHDANQRPMRVLIDPMHGSWSQIAGRALRAVFPHVHIETIRDTPNDKFGELIPNSRIAESVVPTCKAVQKQHADFGVVIDADAGNFTIIDNEGCPLSVEETQWLFIRHLLCDALDGEYLLHDCACSEVLLNEVMKLGAVPVVSGMSPNQFIEDMCRNNAIFGIMSDGSLYFRGTGGNRIVVFAISWLIDYMLCATFKLSDWRKTLPAFNITPELLINGNQLEAVIEQLSKEWSTKPVETIDGYNFSGTAAKVHIRSIEGYEQLGFRFESKSREGLDNIVQRCCAALANFGNIASSLAEEYKQITQTNVTNED